MEKEVHDFSAIPSEEEIRKIIEEIIHSDFSRLSYNKLFRKLQEFQFIPFPTALIKKGHFIERCRINRGEEIFLSENDLSYRTDYENIKTYGRANTIGNPLFYGSFELDLIKQPRLVNLMETSEIFRNLEKHGETETDFVMTVGKWQVQEDFEVAEAVFNTESIAKSPDIKRAFEYHSELLAKEFQQEQGKLQLILEFFSNEFAKKNISSHFDYMVSALYAEMAITMKGLKGVRYASIKTEFQGNNIVIAPSYAEHFLRLVAVAMFRVQKNGRETLVSPIANCIDFGPLNTRFTWQPVAAANQAK